MDLKNELMNYTLFLAEQSVLGLVTILSHQDLVKKYLERKSKEPTDEPQTSNCIKHAVNNCYADDCLIQDSCKSFKTERCNKECKLYA